MGGRNRLVMDMKTAAEFHDKLTEFIEHYSALGKFALLNTTLKSFKIV